METRKIKIGNEKSRWNLGKPTAGGIQRKTAAGPKIPRIEKNQRKGKEEGKRQMPYIVFWRLEGASIIETEGKDTYGEYFTEEQREEARSYFLTLATYAAENREQWTACGAKDYRAAMVYTEDEDEKTPKRTIEDITITPSGAVSINAEEEEEAERIREAIRSKLRGKSKVTDEPTSQRQAEEGERLKGPNKKKINEA